MQHVAIATYQYTEYKHLGYMPKMESDITQFTLQSVKLISPINWSVNIIP